VAAVTLALAAACGVSLFRLRIDPNVEHLLPVDDPTLRLTRHLQGDTPTTRVLYVILRAEDPARLDELVPAVAADLKTSPHLISVTSTRLEFAGARVDWVKQSVLHFLPQETLSRLEARLTPPGRAQELEALQGRIAEDPLGGKATALADPLGLRWIFDEAADRLSERFPAKLRAGSPYLIVERPAVAFVRATGRDDAPNTRFSRALLADVRERIDRITAGTGVTGDLAGSYVSAVTQETALKRDMIVETVFSTVSVLLYVWWFARSLLAAHLVFVPVILATLGALALGGEVFGPLTPIVVSAAAILIAQGIDFPVHFFTRFRTVRLSQGCLESLHSAQRTMTRPFIGIATTTLVAFLALLVSRFPGFRQFGFVLGAGILLCLVAALVVFPLLLIPVDRFVRPAAERTPWVVRVAEAVLRTRWRVPIAWTIVLLGALSWAWVAREGVRMDLDLRNAMAPGDPGRAVLESLEKDLGAALIPVYALIDASVPIEDLRARETALRKTGALAAADGPSDLVPSPQARARVEEFRRRTAGWVEGTLADLARLGYKPGPFRKGLDEMEARFAAPAPGLDALDRPQFESLRRSVRYQSDGRAMHVITMFSSSSIWRPEGREVFDRAARSALGEGADFYSPFHLPDHYSRVLNADLTKVVLITSAGIVILTLASVGHLVDGLIALAPVVLATGMTFGAVVLLGGTINVINMAAIPIILAVGVDGGIHFMVRFRESPGRDAAETIHEVGPGIWGSAATTLLGFGSIATSWTPGMASMGYLVFVGTLTSVFASLFLLPGLLRGRSLPRA
jgi:predicted RND superfamily exporter protein